jgi:T-complex protein 1 subunit gamma
MTELRAKHAQADHAGLYFGIEGNSGKISDMKEADVWDPISVKLQTFKTSIEAACMLLRIDDIVSGIKKERRGGATASRAGDDDNAEGQEGFGDQRDG